MRLTARTLGSFGKCGAGARAHLGNAADEEILERLAHRIQRDELRAGRHKIGEHAFRRLVDLTPGASPELLLVFAAVLPWQFVSTALLESSASLVGNSSLISKVYFPRLLIPMAAVATALVDFLVTLALLAVLMAWYGHAPGWTILALPLFTVIGAALATGLGLLIAALTVKYRDFRYVVPFLVQVGLFISPIAFTTSRLPESLRAVYALNPLVGIIDGFRWSILGASSPLALRDVWMAAAVTLASLTLGVWYFRRVEREFADVI